MNVIQYPKANVIKAPHNLDCKIKESKNNIFTLKKSKYKGMTPSPYKYIAKNHADDNWSVNQKYLPNDEMFFF